jgi:hypothetical protein
MQKNLKSEAAGFAASKPFTPRMVKMDYDGVLVSERMAEIMSMCARNNPIYEQVTSFSVAFYTLGFFDCTDFMSFQDVSAGEAAEILNADFSEIDFDKIPENYHISESKERYLLVIGDPLFPKHFAVVADKNADRPYFSKLPFFGAGYDSMDELVKEFVGIDGVTRDDFHFFGKNWYGQIPPSCKGKIYIVKD